MITALIVWFFNWVHGLEEEEYRYIPRKVRPIVMVKMERVVVTHIAPVYILEDELERRRKEKVRREYAEWKDNNVLLFG